MLPKDQEKLLNDIHSRVIEYLNDIEIKPLFFWNWVVPICAPPWIASDHSFYC